MTASVSTPRRNRLPRRPPAAECRDPTPAAAPAGADRRRAAAARRVGAVRRPAADRPCAGAGRKPRRAGAPRRPRSNRPRSRDAHAGPGRTPAPVARACPRRSQPPRRGPRPAPRPRRSHAWKSRRPGHGTCRQCRRWRLRCRRTPTWCWCRPRAAPSRWSKRRKRRVPSACARRASRSPAEPLQLAEPAARTAAGVARRNRWHAHEGGRGCRLRPFRRRGLPARQARRGLLRSTPMKRLLIVYHTQFGGTGQMAHAALAGAQSAAVEGVGRHRRVASRGGRRAGGGPRGVGPGHRRVGELRRRGRRRSKDFFERIYYPCEGGACRPALRAADLLRQRRRGRSCATSIASPRA